MLRLALGLFLALLVLAGEAAAEPRCWGAASRDPLAPCDNPRLRYTVSPSPREALDAPNAPCRTTSYDEPTRCLFGSPPEDARGTMALIGDSHAVHWRSALLTVASRLRWHGISITRAGCPYTAATPRVPGGGCVPWIAQVRAFLEANPQIDTVVFGQHRGRVVAPAGTDQRKVQIRGYQRAWGALPASVQNVFVIRDTPYLRTYTGRCIEEARRRRREPARVCAVPRGSSLKPDPAARAARRSADPRVHLVDMTRFFCGPTVCYPVVGGVLTHKDPTHLSLAYGLTLGPYLLREFDAILTGSGAQAYVSWL